MSENNNEGMKKCTKCGEWKPAAAEYFNRDRAKKDGLNTCCKECKAESDKIYRKNKNGEMSEYWRSGTGVLVNAVARMRQKTGATIYVRDMTEEQKETLANQYIAVKTLEKTEKELLAASGKKRCKDCGRVLDYCFFYRQQSTKDGLGVLCKECGSRRLRMWWKKRKQKVDPVNPKNDPSILKRCHRCQRLLPATVDWFYIDGRKKDGLGCWCKECRKKYRNNYYKTEKK